MQPSWLENRYSWLDEKGMPTILPEKELEQALATQEDQTYILDEGAQRGSIWREPLDDGQLTAEELGKMKAEPQFSFMLKNAAISSLQLRSISNSLRRPRNSEGSLVSTNILRVRSVRIRKPKIIRNIRNSARR